MKRKLSISRLSRRELVRLLAYSAVSTAWLTDARSDTMNGESQPSAAPDTVELPDGYRKPGDMKWGWAATDDGILPNWKGGSGTKFDPGLIEWNSDGSATLIFRNVDGVWTSGELQVIRPRRPVSERWGAVLSCPKPTAVCALFAFAEDGTEIDFEWRGDNVWQMNLHLFDGAGRRINPSPLPTVSVDVTKPHSYEFAMDAEACVWFVDGQEVARITPADMKGAVWKADARFHLFSSIEHHGNWARHVYEDLPAIMHVHGLLV